MGITFCRTNICGKTDGPDDSLPPTQPVLVLKRISRCFKIIDDSTAALAVATEMLGDPEWWLVGHAADLLGTLGQAARPAVADVERLLGHASEPTRRHVRAAIEKIEAS